MPLRSGSEGWVILASREREVMDKLLLTVLVASLAVPLRLVLGSVLIVYTFDVPLFLAYTVWLVRYVRGEVPRLRFQALDVAFAIMTAWSAVTVVLGVDRLAGINALFFYVRLYLIYLYVAHHIASTHMVRYSVGLLLALIAVEGVLCIIQYVTKTNFGSLPDLVGAQVQQLRLARGEDVGADALLFRTRGTLGRDTALAHWLELLLPVPLGLWLWARERRQQITYAGITAIGFIGLILTFTRGAWMGFFLTTALLGVLLWRQIGFSREYWLALGQVAVVFGLIVLVLSTPIRARLFSQEAIGRSVEVREKLTGVAAEMTYRNPIWGVGLGSFGEMAEEFGARPGFEAAHPERMPHNVYLAMASETGVVGLGLFLIFLAAGGAVLSRTLVVPWALAANVGRGLLAGFCGLLVYNLISWGLLSYQVFPLFWALLGLGSALRQLPLRTGEVSE
jgi:putative inorganic carbon (HCO3(-)) transporter